MIKNLFVPFVMTPKNHLEFLALELEKKYKDVT